MANDSTNQMTTPTVETMRREIDVARAGSHIVALSGGKDSSAMALRLMEIEPRDYRFCITPTGRELPEMDAHWKRLECLLERPLVRVPGPSLVDAIVANNALPNFRMRFCTRQVKIEPFIVYAASLSPAICYVGIRADETSERAGTDWKGVEGVKQDCPLVRWGWGINDVLGYLAKRGVEVPARTDCDCCFFQRISEWWRLWKNHPDRWREVIALEKWSGHTFRTEGKDSWPVSIEDLGKKFEAGYVPKGAAQMTLKLDASQRPTMCAWCAR